ncbi:aminoacyl-tRNA hydrolase [Patescibacteria group bacterium]|nr:aminoacyl-tRNA hydrolase [Patescibacteria group bacterium]MCL5092009.1 aminoacyl-tRNA hydrolase [Patescibacteria group bacterium]
MKLIIGLGNPGEKYQHNRHNVGFMFVDYLLNTVSELTDWRVNGFKADKYSNSQLAELVINDKEILVCKPQTFMNRSGQAVGELIRRYEINPARDLVVVHDDLDIPLGKLKIQSGTGPQLHNGIESIEQILKIKDFLRVRIGVDNRPPANRMDGEAYVLQNFLAPEHNQLYQTIFPAIISRLKLYHLPKTKQN